MKIDDIVMLIKAGYSKTDIETLCNNNQDVPEITEEIPVETHDEQPAANEEVKPVDDFNDKIKALETKVDYVVNRMNYIAVKDSNQPEETAKESLDDILAKMIR